MKRKLIIGFVAFFMLTGSAYAAVNGTYKGRQIVSVLVNGKQIQSTVPGQIIDGSTMLPLKAVADALGAKVTWDNTKKQASITTSQAPAQTAQQGLSLEQLNKIGESVGLIYAFNGQTFVANGSGFITDGDVFVTNWHVVQKADNLDVRFADQQVLLKVSDAIFKDEKEDLIGFRVKGFPSLELNTSTPKNKDKVYSLGYPRGKFQITEGIYETPVNDDEWMHSAKIDGGSSGGILIDVSGKVIGVNSYGMGGPGTNFAIRSSILQDELNKL